MENGPKQTMALLISLDGRRSDALQIFNHAQSNNRFVTNPDTTFEYASSQSQIKLVTDSAAALTEIEQMKSQDLVIIVGKPSVRNLLEIVDAISQIPGIRAALVGETPREEATAKILGLSFIPLSALKII